MNPFYCSSQNNCFLFTLLPFHIVDFHYTIYLLFQLATTWQELRKTVTTSNFQKIILVHHLEKENMKVQWGPQKRYLGEKITVYIWNILALEYFRDSHCNSIFFQVKKNWNHNAGWTNKSQKSIWIFIVPCKNSSFSIEMHSSLPQAEIVKFKFFVACSDFRHIKLMIVSWWLKNYFNKLWLKEVIWTF